MSWVDCDAPDMLTAPSCDPVDMVIVPRARDIGGFEVRRVLPSVKRRMVGPFIFFDQMGPVEFPGGKGLDVRPHPHIGLATVTYLFDGTIIHRDSVASVQAIRPGDVNWMTAGRGIVHSERSDPELRKLREKVSGLQIWVALPQRHEETAPSFAHHGRDSLPTASGDGSQVRVIAGSLYGLASPVKTLSDLFYADVALEAGARIVLDAAHAERAAYLLEGSINIAGTAFEPGRLVVFAPGRQVVIAAATKSRFVLLGGEPIDGPRHIWWNFVSSRRERIEQAKDDWKRGRFASVPGETEFIPLPEDS